MMSTATETIYALRTAAAHIERTLSRAIEPYGITSAQFELLQAIAKANGKSGGCSGLGKQLAAPGPDVTRMLDRLDAAGLVSRSRDEKDRRVVHAVLTEKARELLDVATPVVSQAEATLFDGVEDGDVSRLSELLNTLKRKCPGG
jgi:DNA-binding MarR family transcriptional regulator